MNNLKDISLEYNFKIKSVKYLGKVIILYTDKGNYVYKNNNNYKIYDYLSSRNFNFYPKTINNKNTKYEITEYIEQNNVSKDQRLNDLIHITGFLHKRTIFNKELSLEEIKSMYEDISNDANYLMNYYQDINNYIDNQTFMSPSEYLLVSNIDIFYYLLSFVKVESENWYKEINNNKTIRFSMIHDNLDLSHIIEGNNLYLTSWNKAHIDYFLKDLINIYQRNYNMLDLEDYIKEYEKENKLNNIEYLYLLLKLSIPKRIEFTRNTYLDTYNISNYLVYLKKIVALIQKYDKMKQKS